MALDFNTTSFSIAAFSVIVLLVIQIKYWRPGVSSLVMLFATSVTLFWCLSLLFEHRLGPSYFYVILLLESLRNFAWIVLLLSLLGIRSLLAKNGSETGQRWGLVWLSLVSLGIPAYFAISLLALIFVLANPPQLPDFGGRNVLLGISGFHNRWAGSFRAGYQKHPGLPSMAYQVSLSGIGSLIFL